MIFWGSLGQHIQGSLLCSSIHGISCQCHVVYHVSYAHAIHVWCDVVLYLEGESLMMTYSQGKLIVIFGLIFMFIIGFVGIFWAHNFWFWGCVSKKRMYPPFPPSFYCYTFLGFTIVIVTGVFGVLYVCFFA